MHVCLSKEAQEPHFGPVFFMASMDKLNAICRVIQDEWHPNVHKAFFHKFKSRTELVRLCLQYLIAQM